MQRTRRRRLGFALGIAVALVVALGIGAFLAAPPAIDRVVESRLRDAGFPAASASGVRFGAGRLVVERLSLAADAFYLDDIRIPLTTGGFGRITVGGIYVEAAPGDGFAVPGFEAREPAARGDPLANLPGDGVDVERAEVRVLTNGEPVRGLMTGLRLTPGPDGAVVATADYSIEHPALALAGRLTGTVRGDGAIDAEIGVADGAFDAGSLRGEPVSGTIGIDITPTSRRVDVELAAEESALAEATLGAMALAGTYRNGTVDGVLRVAAGPGAVVAELIGVSLTGQTARGRIDVNGSDLVWPGLISNAVISMTGLIDGSLDGLRVETTEPWSAAFTADPGLWPDSLQALAGATVSLEARSRDAGPLAVVVDRGRQRVTFAASLDAAAATSRARVEGDFSVRRDTGLAIDVDGLLLNASGLPWSDLDLDVERFGGRASYAESAWRLDGAGTIAANGTVAEASVESLRVDFAGAVAGTATAVTVTAPDCLDWSVASIEFRGTRLTGFDPACIGAVEDALLSHNLADGRTRFAAGMASVPLDAVLARPDESTSGPASYALVGTWPELRLSGEIGGEAGVDLAASAAGGALRVETAGIAIRDLAAGAELRAGTWQSLSVSVGTIESLATPAIWAPLGLEATAEPRDASLAFDALLSDALGSFVLEATGELRGAAGDARVMLYAVQFLSGALEVGDLSPQLAEYVTDASGTLTFSGELSWDADTIESAGQVGLDDFGATVFGIPVAGVDTRTALTSLWPPATAPEQRVDIARISLGAALENGQLVYDRDAEGRLAIHELSFEMAGGRIRSDAFTVDSGAEADSRFVLEIEGVGLAQLLELSEIDGLDGTGTLSGELPIRIQDDRVWLDDGRLEAVGGGTLRYTPDNLPAFLRGDELRAQMLREALTDFEYDQLSVTVTGESGESGQQRVRFEAAGANPEFLDGHPIELVFTFQGPLLGAMSSAVDVTSAAEIEDLFEQQQLGIPENER